MQKKHFNSVIEFTIAKSLQPMIIISADKFIGAIQVEFNVAFPFLRIEFLLHGERRRNNTKSACLPNELQIGTVSMRNKDGVIEIKDITTVRELQKKCVEQFGISIQLYRKSGNIWLETSMTDNWTMQQQNESGLELSTLLRKEV